ncbi:MAG: FHA domain-containing protein [Pirellulales bacterium]|nr:FHA domain-containing protein [Pirellulales bacterium]
MKLTVVGGKANKREVVINLPATIGRSRDADLTVGHRMVSRKHCETYLDDGVMMIRDVGSLNGTYVKGRRVRSAPLLPGAKFTIGPITFRVHYQHSGKRAKLPPIVPAEPDEETAVPEAEAKPAPAKSRPAKKSPDAEPAAPDAPAKKPSAKKPSPAPIAAEKEPDFVVVEEEDDDFELALEADLDRIAKQSAPASKNSKPKPAESKKPAEQEPDFVVVEEEDDDFELALREDLGKNSKPSPAAGKNAKQKPTPSKSGPEKDPEDQLLDDFLNDLQ